MDFGQYKFCPYILFKFVIGHLCQRFAGSDIMEGNQTLTLALVWQLMRAYTLSLLSKLNEDGTPIVESEIISWANNKVSTSLHHILNIVEVGKAKTQTQTKKAQTSKNVNNEKYVIGLQTFAVDGGWEELTDQAFPRQDKQDGIAHNRPHRRHEDWRH